jgi:hypothetical protein
MNNRDRFLDPIFDSPGTFNDQPPGNQGGLGNGFGGNFHPLQNFGNNLRGLGDAAYRGRQMRGRRSLFPGQLRRPMFPLPQQRQPGSVDPAGLARQQAIMLEAAQRGLNVNSTAADFQGVRGQPLANPNAGFGDFLNPQNQPLVPQAMAGGRGGRIPMKRGYY